MAQFPNIVPPADPGADNLCRRRCADRRGLRGHAHRAADERASKAWNTCIRINANNGMYTLNVIFDTSTVSTTDQILAQMRQTQASAQLPQDVTNFGVTVDQSTSSPLGVFVLYSPKGRTTHLSRQLLATSISMTRCRVSRAWERQCFRCRPVRHADLGLARPTGHTEYHRAGRHPSRSGAERCQSGRPDRRRACAAGSGFHVCGRSHRAAWLRLEDFESIVIRANSDGSIVRSQGCRARRSGCTDLQPTRAASTDRTPAILAIYQLPGSNAVDTMKQAQGADGGMQAAVSRRS